MMEKYGVVNEENTNPEKEGEKDLENHLTKRAADAVNKSNADSPDTLKPKQSVKGLPVRP